MKRPVRVELETTVADLLKLSRHLRDILPEMADGPLKDDLNQMLQQSELAVDYYRSLMTPKRPVAMPEAVWRAAEAATVPIGGPALQVQVHSPAPKLNQSN